jgi:hypothetical protein
MILGVSPEPTPFHVSHGFIFRCPEFEFERIKPLTPTGIGSGNDLPRVFESLAELVAPESLNQGLLRFEVGLPMGGADALGFALGIALEESDETVSQEFQIWRVRQGEIRVGTNEQEALTPGATNRVMPPLARSWREFQEMSAKVGHSAAEAVA